MSKAGKCASDAAKQFYFYGFDNQTAVDIENCVNAAWLDNSDDIEKFQEAVVNCTLSPFESLTEGITEASCLQGYPELVSTVATCAGDKLDSDKGLGVMVQGVQSQFKKVKALDFPSLPKEARTAAQKVLATETQEAEQKNNEKLASLEKELSDPTGGELATYSAVALYAGLAFSALTVLA